MKMKIICKNCGQLKKYDAYDLCKSCYMRNFRRKNPNYNKKWQKDNSEKTREKAKKWYKNNRGKRAKSMKQWRENNSEYSKRYKKEWKKANPEKERKYMIKWRQDNPEKTKEYNLKRRIPGIIKKNIVNKLVNENIFKYGIITCEKCRKSCEGNYHIDHIKPVSKGGMNDYENLQVLCANCNHTKFTKIVDYRKKQINNQLSLGG